MQGMGPGTCGTAMAAPLASMHNSKGTEPVARRSTSVARPASPQVVGAALVDRGSHKAKRVNGRLLPANGGSLVA